MTPRPRPAPIDRPTPMMTTAGAWIELTRERLLHLRHGNGAWGYRDGSAPAVEPSALAALALLATGHDAEAAIAHGAARWVADRARRRDGSVAVSADAGADSPGWATPFAMLLWEAVGGFKAERRAATDWLLGAKGVPGVPMPLNPMGHDVTLVGWAWVDGTHSWVEPTAAALLALAPRVPPGQPRVAEGVQLLLDRATPTGGWNLGNPRVFGRALRPLPAPTGLALLALARVARAATPAPILYKALAYLANATGSTLAPASLGWAAMGLRAWDPGRADALSSRLALAADRALAHGAGAAELAPLLLAAAGDASLRLLGIDPPAASEPSR